MRKPVTVVALLLLISPAGAKTRNQPTTPPPLVRMEAPPPPIQVVTAPAVPSWTYGNWKVSDMGDFSIASTLNDSQSAFGMVCGKTCVWFVNFQKECENGQDYPAMINTPGGAYAIQLRCYHLDDRALLTFSIDAKNDANAMAKGGEIGFAFPLQSGKFGVSRFSLTGGAAATSKAITLATQKREQNQEGVRDFTI